MQQSGFDAGDCVRVLTFLVQQPHDFRDLSVRSLIFREEVIPNVSRFPFQVR